MVTGKFSEKFRDDDEKFLIGGYPAYGKPSACVSPQDGPVEPASFEHTFDG